MRGQQRPLGLCKCNMAWNLLCLGAGKQNDKGVCVEHREVHLFYRYGKKAGDSRWLDFNNAVWSSPMAVLHLSDKALKVSSVNFWVAPEISRYVQMS